MTTGSDGRPKSAARVVDLTNLRQRAEEKASAMGEQGLEALWTEEARRLLHELRVRQIELELENEELRRALDQLQEQLGLIIDNVPAYIVYVDADLHVLHCNRAYAGFWGCSKEQVIGMRVKDVASPETYSEVERYLQQIMASRRGVTYESEVVAANGQTYVMWRSYVPQLDEQGNVAGIVALILNVTEQRRAEEALRASEERYRLVVENMGEGLMVVDGDGVLSYVNDALCTMMGLARHELVGHRSLILFPREGQEQHLGWLARRRKGHSDTYETVLQRHNGSRFPALVSAGPMLDSEGNYRGSVAVCTDISERVETEERLRRRVEEVSALNLIARTVSTVAELPVALAQASAIMSELFAAHCVHIIWSEGEEPGSRLHVACEAVSERASPLRLDVPLNEMALLGRLLREGRSQVVTDIRSVPVSDLERKLLVHRDVQSILFTPLVIGGMAVGLLWVARDQMGRAFTEDEIRLAETIGLDLAAAIESTRSSRQAQAMAVAEERGRLARDLHDSVTQVLFSANLVAETLPQLWERNPERARQSLENLRRLTRGALAEMRTLLLELRPSAVANTPLGELLAQLTEAVTSRSGLPARLFIERVPALPEGVQMSFYRIAQEALNNVVKHAQAKHVIVSLGATPIPDSIGASGHRVRLVIQDDGVGFSSGRRQSVSLGIGIMHERAAAVGADLALESQPGRGTQVILTWSNGARDES